ncbi:hypothetical protein ACN4EK_31930 [Pantanalinema rosaneae CENA516]|uniref:hypothetical protein n=1 Tax=Pantanalinema rosaneae TaxID=1620701 RepID=UPI003D6EC378
MKKTQILLFLIALGITSCQRNSLDSTLNLPGTCGSKEIQGTQVQYIVINNKPTLVLWADYVGSERSTCGSALEDSYAGEIKAGGSKQIEWQWGSPDGKQNIVSINGIPFDFNQGNVFLIPVVKGDRIQQLQRDLKADSTVFEQLSKNDPEIRQFVEGSAPK